MRAVLLTRIVVSMTTFTFNSTPLTTTATDFPTFPDSEVEATPVLRRASMANAALFGSPLLRRVLETTPIVGDRAHVFVDTKVTFLMPGWVPSIPGWHTDGVPRGPGADPASRGVPDLALQHTMRSPRFHTLFVGSADCPTRFMTSPLSLDVQSPSRQLYADISTKVSALLDDVTVVEPAAGEWDWWDWWQLHCAIPSRTTGWRLLVRVTETDYVAPAETEFIRAQSQVYVPSLNVGW